jgi:hypothetical protein
MLQSVDLSFIYLFFLQSAARLFGSSISPTDLISVSGVHHHSLFFSFVCEDYLITNLLVPILYDAEMYGFCYG